MRVIDNRQKCHSMRHEKILNVYDDFNTYVMVLSLRCANNFRHLDIQHHVVTLEAIIVVSRLSHNNNTTTVLSNLFIPYLRES